MLSSDSPWTQLSVRPDVGASAKYRQKLEAAGVKNLPNICIEKEIDELAAEPEDSSQSDEGQR